jgi:hypothetical protein
MRTFKKRVADQKPRDYTRLTQEFRVNKEWNSNRLHIWCYSIASRNLFIIRLKETKL